MTSTSPFPTYVPQSVKIYPLHQIYADNEAPAINSWQPKMSPSTKRHLRRFGDGADKLYRQLYLHIPFCPTFCHFCCLYKTKDSSQQSADYREVFVRALLKEIEAYGRLESIAARRATSIYFGGGTPSMLSVQQVERILEAIRKHLPLADDVEITFEGLATQLADREYMSALHGLGINRVSYGVQTFDRGLRKQLGRTETVEEILEAANVVRAVGIKDLNIEFLIGLPNQSTQTVLEDLRIAAGMPIDTLDVLLYNTVPGSKYYDMIKNGARPPASAGDELLAMRSASIDFLASLGFSHTTGEIFDRVDAHLDNFNETHYGGQTGLDEMIALGPSAYGFLDGVTYHNIPSVTKYLAMIEDGRFPIRMHRQVTPAQARLRAFLFGIQLFHISENAVPSLYHRWLLWRWTRRGLVERDNTGWTVTTLGKLWYNMMQLEAVPGIEALKSMSLIFDPEEERRILFNIGETQGNTKMARALEKMIQGKVPLISRIRRLGYFWVLRPIRNRLTGRLTFTGPEEL